MATFQSRGGRPPARRLGAHEVRTLYGHLEAAIRALDVDDKTFSVEVLKRGTRWLQNFRARPPSHEDAFTIYNCTSMHVTTTDSRGLPVRLKRDARMLALAYAPRKADRAPVPFFILDKDISVLARALSERFESIPYASFKKFFEEKNGGSESYAASCRRDFQLEAKEHMERTFEAARRKSNITLSSKSGEHKPVTVGPSEVAAILEALPSWTSIEMRKQLRKSRLKARKGKATYGQSR